MDTAVLWEATRFLALVAFLVLFVVRWRVTWYLRVAAGMGWVLIWTSGFPSLEWLQWVGIALFLLTVVVAYALLEKKGKPKSSEDGAEGENNTHVG